MAIAHLLHIHPRDLDRLTVAEFDRACAFVDAWKASNNQS